MFINAVKKIILIFLLCVHFGVGFCQNGEAIFYGGTTVIGYVGRDSIVIAADSKAVIRDHNSNIIRDSTICKILVNNKRIFAFAGNYIGVYFTDGWKFDIRTEMINTLNEQKDFEKALSDFLINTNKKLDTVILNIKKGNNSFIDSILKQPYLVETLIGYFKNGKTLLTKIYFRVQGNKDNWRVVNEISALQNMYNETFYLGIHDCIITYLSIEKGYFSKSSPIKEKLKNLIKLETEKHNQFVGEPIDIVFLSPNIHKWLSPKRKDCQK